MSRSTSTELSGLTLPIIGKNNLVELSYILTQFSTKVWNLMITL